MEIQEKFVPFLDFERLTGEHIAQKMLNFYEESRINPKQCRSCCLNGAQICNQKRMGLLVLSLKKSDNVVTHCFVHNQCCIHKKFGDIGTVL